MAQKQNNAATQAMASQQQTQKKMLASYKMYDRRMKWAIIIAGIIIVLLLLLLGFATDWTKGLQKDNSSSKTPISSNLDALRTTNGTASPATDTSNTGTTTTGGGETSTTTGSTDHTSSTTTNNSTTTTTNNTTSAPGQPSNGLLDLYSNSTAGDSVQSTLDKAEQLGITPDCQTEILVQVCNLTDSSGNTVTLRNIVGTDVISGVTKNF